MEDPHISSFLATSTLLASSNVLWCYISNTTWGPEKTKRMVLKYLQREVKEKQHIRPYTSAKCKDSVKRSRTSTQ